MADPVQDASTATLTQLPDSARFVLRCRAAGIAPAGTAFGVPLPQQPCRAASTGKRAALWLGPDEWLLIAPVGEGSAVGDTLTRALAGQAHSLVDVSHREIAFELAGRAAACVLNTACPLDLDIDSFPVGMCTRTVLAKAQILLWRTAPTCFQIALARSFAGYAWQLLDGARHEPDL
jgi:sarcosine oxidase subunit gamma